MKSKLLLILALLFMISCSDDDNISTEQRDGCVSILENDSNSHPHAARFQSIADKYTTSETLVGSLILVKDNTGYWIGSSGKANLERDKAMLPCDVGFIASISKVFTAAAVYRYIDAGILSFDDPVGNYLNDAIVAEIANLEEATVSQLLAHTSGIPDFYTDAFEDDRQNNQSKIFTNENMLEYVYGLAPLSAPGERYSYSNTNFALLSLVLEGVSGKDFGTIYKEEIFDVLNLSSAYYGEGEARIPSFAVTGYLDLENNGTFIDSRFRYRDELGVGGDGGIAMNTYDLARFFEQLLKGQLISAASLKQMTTLVDIPEDEQVQEIGQFQNGFGIERYDLPFGTALGHTGLIDGFSSFAFYFPEEDYTVILINNSVSQNGAEAQVGLLTEILQTIFQ